MRGKLITCRNIGKAKGPLGSEILYESSLVLLVHIMLNLKLSVVAHEIELMGHMTN